jgi:hypothetical protein
MVFKLIPFGLEKQAYLALRLNAKNKYLDLILVFIRFSNQIFWFNLFIKFGIHSYLSYRPILLVNKDFDLILVIKSLNQIFGLTYL